VTAEPAVSVIIPTCNRCARLQQTLDGLRNQTYPAERTEVVVVADGCTDGTSHMLSQYQAPFTLHPVEQANQGPSVARNQGAAAANGRLLIFLDDDIESTPRLIEAHVCAHSRERRRVVIGYLPVPDQGPATFFQTTLRNWWEGMFRPMRQHGYRHGYWNLLSGHFSLEKDLYAQVGGFDPTLRCHEDYELGIRLIQAGASFAFAADAVGYHHEKTDLDRSLRRKYEEGRADVAIGRRYPELRATLPLARFRKPLSSWNRRMRTLAFAWPAGSERVMDGLKRALDLLEWARSRRRWHRLVDELLDYWYWRGVAAELGSQQSLLRFLQDVPTDIGTYNEIELDLSIGLEAAEREIDEKRPDGIWIRYGQQPIGHIPPKPGAERLRGAHLRPVLATQLAWPLLMALAWEEATVQATEIHQVLAESPIRAQEAVPSSAR
jgi:glycosyltransferase involved in cell wall biosynthesis